MTPKDDLDARLLAVADAHLDQERFAPLARQLAEDCDLQALRDVWERFHREPPPDFRPETPEPARSFAWQFPWWNALCEVAYQAGEGGLPAVREVAFNGGDPAQAAASNVLCRLAAEGVATETFFADVLREFPTLTPGARAVLADWIARYREPWTQTLDWPQASMYLGQIVWRTGPATDAYRRLAGETLARPEFQEALQEEE